MDALVDKESFLGLDKCTWLYSGAETPPLKGCIEALHNYMINRCEGPGGREENTRVEMSCKENIARLINGSRENIAFLSNSSEAISMVAQSLHLLPGDNVVINTLEFPSGVLPWLQFKEKGIEIRIVNHNQWMISVEDILGQVDARTKLVVSSHVSYFTGARLDYKLLYGELQKTDTLLLLDVTQSLGAVSVDMNYADITVCSSYKWLLSIHGIGILAINPKRIANLLPKYIGWRSVSDMFSLNRFESFTYFDDARRFELGYPSYSAIYTMNFSTNLLLQIGIERIEKHILTLGEHLIQQLTQLGYEAMTPADPQKRAGNICIASDQGEKIANHLRERNVYVWGGDGRLRASIHLFNDSADIEHLVRMLPTG